MIVEDPWFTFIVGISSWWDDSSVWQDHREMGVWYQGRTRYFLPCPLCYVGGCIMCVRERCDTSCHVWGSWDAWVWLKLEVFIGCNKPLFGHPKSVRMGISKKETGQPKNGMSLMTNSEKNFKKHKFFPGITISHAWVGTHLARSPMLAVTPGVSATQKRWGWTQG